MSECAAQLERAFRPWQFLRRMALRVCLTTTDHQFCAFACVLCLLQAVADVSRTAGRTGTQWKSRPRLSSRGRPATIRMSSRSSLLCACDGPACARSRGAHAARFLSSSWLSRFGRRPPSGHLGVRAYPVTVKCCGESLNGSELCYPVQHLYQMPTCARFNHKY